MREQLFETIRDELAGWPIGSGYYATKVAVHEAGEMADAVLALLPGRSEAEVKAEALEEAASVYDVAQISGVFFGAAEYARAWLRARAASLRGE